MVRHAVPIPVDLPTRAAHRDHIPVDLPTVARRHDRPTAVTVVAEERVDVREAVRNLRLLILPRAAIAAGHLVVEKERGDVRGLVRLLHPKRFESSRKRRRKNKCQQETTLMQVPREQDRVLRPARYLLHENDRLRDHRIVNVVAVLLRDRFLEVALVPFLPRLAAAVDLVADLRREERMVVKTKAVPLLCRMDAVVAIEEVLPLRILEVPQGVHRQEEAVVVRIPQGPAVARRTRRDPTVVPEYALHTMHSNWLNYNFIHAKF